MQMNPVILALASLERHLDNRAFQGGQLSFSGSFGRCCEEIIRDLVANLDAMFRVLFVLQREHQAAVGRAFDVYGLDTHAVAERCRTYSQRSSRQPASHCPVVDPHGDEIFPSIVDQFSRNSIRARLVTALALADLHAIDKDHIIVVHSAVLEDELLTIKLFGHVEALPVPTKAIVVGISGPVPQSGRMERLPAPIIKLRGRPFVVVTRAELPLA